MKGKLRLTMNQKTKLEGYFFILPWLIGFIAFFAMPFFKSIQLSFSKITKIAGFEMEWIGWQHYAKAFTWDVYFVPMFINTMRNTLITIPLTVVFSLFIAILINRNIKFKGFFRGAFFIPVLLGTGFVMKQLLGMNVQNQAIEVAMGIVMPDEILNYLGPDIAAYVTEFMYRITLIFWRSGVQVVLFLAGLQSIPNSMYEAARCDAATEWEMLWKITLPMITPVISLNCIYTLIDSFTDVNNPIVDYILDMGFKSVQYEYAAAMSWIYLLFVFIVVILIFVIFRRFSYDSKEG